MTERTVFEYLLNSLWQLPLLVAATWLVIRIARPTLLLQHLLWLAALVFAVLLPLHGASAPTLAAAQTDLVLINPRLANVDNFPIAEPAPITLHDCIQTLSSVRVTDITLSSRVIHWTVLLYAVAFSFSLLRLLLSWRKTLALRAASSALPITALESSLLNACAERLNLRYLPELRFLDDTRASPMVIGALKPVLLLPETLRHSTNADFDDQALAAILAHELAHIRRHDFLVNLLARIVALPIAYHPATHAIHRRIRQTREMICDAHAVGTLDSAALYARSLLSLAARLMQPQPAQPQPALEAVGLFDHTSNASTLEERIMHLTAPKLPISFVRIALGSAVLTAATCTAAAFHLTPATPAVYAAQIQAAQIQQAAPAPTPAPTPDPTPAPQQAATPKPSPTPAPKLRHTRAVVDGEVRDLTPQEQEKLDHDLAAANEQLSTLSIKLKDLKIPKIDLSQLKVLNSPEFQKQFAELKVNSPEFQKSMAELKVQLDSPAFKQQLQLTQRLSVDSALHSAEIKRDLDNVRIQIDSPEFQKQIAEAKTQAIQSRTQLAETRKQLEEASRVLAEARKSITDANIQRQLDEAQRHIDNAVKK